MRKRGGFRKGGGPLLKKKGGDFRGLWRKLGGLMERGGGLMEK